MVPSLWVLKPWFKVCFRDKNHGFKFVAVKTMVLSLYDCTCVADEPVYPHLKTLLKFDTREFFNVLALVSTEHF